MDGEPKKEEIGARTLMDQPEKLPWNERLRQERIRRNWRQREVAEHLGTTPVTVTRWERGSHLPSAYFRVKLCALFGKSEQELGFVESRILSLSDEESVSDELSRIIETPSEALSLPDDAHKVSLRSTRSFSEDPSVDSSASSEPSEQRAPVILLLSRRKVLLIGVGGLAAAAALAFWQLGSKHSSSSDDPKSVLPLHVPLSQRSHHLFDPNNSNWINHVAWSPDSRYLAVAVGTNVMSVWNIGKDVVALTYPTLNQWVNDVSWSKTNWIAAVTAESGVGAGAGSLQLRKFPEQAPALTMKKDYALRSVSWSPDDTYLAISGHNPTVEVWRPFPYHLMSSYTDTRLGYLGITRVRWSPSGRFLACAADDGTAHVWEALTGKPRVIYSGHQSRVHDLAWSPDERAIISCSEDQTSHVWSASNGQTLRIYRGQKGVIEGVDWSPGGTWVASASADQTVHIWTPFAGKLIAVYDKYDSIVETVHWSADGAWLSIGTENNGVEIWPCQY